MRRCRAVPSDQPRRPHRPMECTPPQDGDLRLARVRCCSLLHWLVRRRRQAGNGRVGPGESGRALKILDDGFRQPAAETVLIQSDTLQADAPEFVAATRAVVAALGRESEVTKIRSPLDSENAGQISEDGHSALVEFQIRGDADLAVDKIDPILARVRRHADRTPARCSSATFGDASVDQELEGAFMDDLKKAGIYSVPITLIILIVVFGALVAAGIPLLLALTAVIATFGLWAIPSHVWPSDESLYAMVLLIGLAVGVDYSMFYLKREREERAAGRSAEAALEAAASTSGRSVLISGVDRHHRDGGHALRRRRTFAPFGVGDDDRRRRRGARLADGAAGRALAAGRQRRSPPRAVRPSASTRRTARAGSGARSSTASCVVRCSRSRSAGGLLLLIAAPALTASHRRAGHRHVPAGARRR